MKLAFTGHRDQTVDPAELERLVTEYPDHVWTHGGADGFDRQVDDFARARGIKREKIRPDYKKYADRPKFAPLARNEVIVDGAALLVACYDGRQVGGTFYTVEYAKRVGVPVRVLECGE